MLVALAIGLAASLAGRRAAPPERPLGPPEHGPAPVTREVLEEALEEDALYCPPTGTLLDSGLARGADSSHCSAPLTLNAESDFRGADARR